MSLFVFTLWNEVRKSIIIAVSQPVGQLAEKNGRCRLAGWAENSPAPDEDEGDVWHMHGVL